MCHLTGSFYCTRPIREFVAANTYIDLLFMYFSLRGLDGSDVAYDAFVAVVCSLIYPFLVEAERGCPPHYCSLTQAERSDNINVRVL